MRMPKKRGIYSVNEGNSLYWEENTKAYFNSLKYPTEEGGKPYVTREGVRAGKMRSYMFL